MVAVDDRDRADVRTRCACGHLTFIHREHADPVLSRCSWLAYVQGFEHEQGNPERCSDPERCGIAVDHYERTDRIGECLAGNGARGLGTCSCTQLVAQPPMLWAVA